MYIEYIELQNFRSFKEKTRIDLKKGLNVLVGENDSGKSAIIDAIRIALGTTDQNWYRIELSDFSDENQNNIIHISLKFSELNLNEAASFLECLTYEQNSNGQINPCLYLHWEAKYLLNFSPPRITSKLVTGFHSDGPTLPTEAKELLKVTYLRALRDAYSNMQAGRNSRLSQVLQSIPNLNQGIPNYSSDIDLAKLSLTGIADLSNTLLKNHQNLGKANAEIQAILKSKMLLNGDSIRTDFSVSGADATESKKLVSLLEKLDLSANSKNNQGKVGLGTSNLLSMACELLLNKQSGSSFLLIEEPEAHIHAQRQLRLMQSLQKEINNIERSQQIIVTTHSPILASVVKLENLTIIKDSKAYSLQYGKTKLDHEDYKFLERYLDATKANLFFAKAVLMVEGPSEELLLPTIAKLIKKDLTEFGVSIVNVRGVGFRRYARIFQRKDSNNQLMIKVACVTDRDIMPDCAPEICLNSKFSDRSTLPKERKWKIESELSPKQKETHLSTIRLRADGQQVKTFIAKHWTFEYDLAYAGLGDELFEAILNVGYTREKIKSEYRDKLAEYKKESIEKAASYIYSFFSKNLVSKVDVAQELANILEQKYEQLPDELKSKLPKYIIEALEHITSREIENVN